MLKPRFKDKKELVSDFKAALDYFDKDYVRVEHDAPPPAKPLQESVEKTHQPEIKAEAARLSQYSSSNSFRNSFKVLSGLVSKEAEPWNPGIVGETRSVKSLKEAFEMEDDGDRPSMYHHKKDLGGYTPKAAHQAISHSHRVLGAQHATHSYIRDLDPKTQAHLKDKLGNFAAHAAYKLRGAADGADPETHAKLHSLANRHERHAMIYAKGGLPKLEAIEEMIGTVEDLIKG